MTFWKVTFWHYSLILIYNTSIFIFFPHATTKLSQIHLIESFHFDRLHPTTNLSQILSKFHLLRSPTRHNKIITDYNRTFAYITSNDHDIYTSISIHKLYLPSTNNDTQQNASIARTAAAAAAIEREKPCIIRREKFRRERKGGIIYSYFPSSHLQIVFFWFFLKKILNNLLIFLTTNLLFSSLRFQTLLA